MLDLGEQRLLGDRALSHMGNLRIRARLGVPAAPPTKTPGRPAVRNRSNILPHLKETQLANALGGDAAGGEVGDAA